MKDPIIIRVEYVEEYPILFDEEDHLIEPRCPGCEALVDRPKCMWEASDCPRHPWQDAYREALKMDPKNHVFKKYGYRPEECSLCHKLETEH